VEFGDTNRFKITSCLGHFAAIENIATKTRSNLVYGRYCVQFRATLVDVFYFCLTLTPCREDASFGKNR
jgi:hypothetical protein